MLGEPSDGLSPPVLKRAQMLRMMKHAKVILKRGRKKVVRRKASKIIDEILELMPELKVLRAGQETESAELPVTWHQNETTACHSHISRALDGDCDCREGEITLGLFQS